MPFCPKCLEEFEVSGGFCPHDGTALKAGKAPRTDRDVGNRTDEDAALARLRGHGVGVEDEVSATKQDYDRFLGVELDQRYLITRKLGEGGMGVVFFGRHVVIEKPVAIKVLKSVVSRDPSIVQRFVQEARAASRIGHPNIVDVTDFGKTPDGLAYQVMEFLDGPTLSDLIYTRKKVGLDEALPIVAQIARALGAAHRKGIVHRDLKPDNVFLIERHGRTDFVKIVDFGIAKVAPTGEQRSSDGPKLTRAGSVFGTPEYMAPEQASGSSSIDHRADIYALGAIFYEMLIGRVPLVGENTVRTLAMVILDPVEPPSTAHPELQLPEPVEAVLMKALAKKPDDRWQSMDEFADALEKATGRKLLPKLAGIGSLPPQPPPSSPAIALPPVSPDTVPDVDPPAAPEPDDIDEGRPTKLFEGSATGKSKRRRNRASTYDPAFVETARPGFDEIPEPRVTEFLDGSAKKRRAPLVLALAVVGGGAALAGWLVARESGAGAAAALAADAAVVGAPAVVIDAAPEQAAVLADAAAAMDAGSAAVAPAPPDSGKRPVKSPLRPATTADRREVRVEIITRPGDGKVLVNGMYRGPDGVTLSEPLGATLDITCKLYGHIDGRVRVTVSRDGEIVVCDMKPKPNCNPELKSPWCE